MAVMWPRKLPPDVLRNPLRSTECEVYRKLESSLSDAFTVFYSRPWLGLTATGEEIDGECDFVVAHAELGLLALEVKGGAVSYDPAEERWTSRDRWNLRHTIRNPVQQARSSKHRILEKLKQSSQWSVRRIRARHGIVLPHSARPPGDLGADMPLRIFCFEEEFRTDFGKWVRSRFGDPADAEGNEGPLGHDGLKALEKLLAQPFQLKTPLGRILVEDDNELTLLTQQQFHILSCIEAIPRAAVSGAAGTGKTVLAVEEARRCAEAGRRTLFTCFNRALALSVLRNLNGIEGLTVASFHDWCEAMAAETGVKIPRNVPQQRLLDEIYPEALMQALDRLPSRRFDAVVVDEGQDFLPLWWSAVDASLSGPGSSLRIFFDSNQRVYKTVGKLPEDVQLVPIRLTQNMRNTQRIHDIVTPQYEGFAITAIGPEGVAVDVLAPEGPQAIRRQLEKIIARLITVEKVQAEDIAVLVEAEKDVSALSLRDKCGGQPVANCEDARPGSIVVDTIARFKGLESLVVVVICTPQMLSNRELPYVAFSRARTHLVLMGPQAVLDRLRA